MVKLGTLKSVERLNFKTWIEKYGREGNYPVRIIFPPKNFPSFSLIFEDKVNGKRLDVKLTIKRQIFKEVMKALDINLKAANLPPIMLVIKNGEYGLDISDEDYVLEWRGSYWIRVAQKDDIPF